MPWVTDEQIAESRKVDLLTYLRHCEPGELVETRSPGEYRTASHGSLVISNGKWIWNRGKIGGRTAVDYLTKIRGMRFNDAVEAVLGSGAVIAPSPLLCESPSSSQQKKWTFYPPKPCRYSNLAIAYLQRRGISPEVIVQALQDGIFFESRYYNPKSDLHNAAVCAFAGKDDAGKTVFAALRGIDADFKMDKAGSDKRFGFRIPASNPDSRHLAVFEAPIDALSHATLGQRDGWHWSGHRLSLGGTSDVALIAFLERNPQMRHVTLHLDNDVAGLTAAGKIKATLAADKRFKHIRVSINPPRRGKDYNEALLNILSTKQEQKTLCRREAALSL